MSALDSPSSPGPPVRGHVRVSACVDRVLHDLSGGRALPRKVELAALPELRCDGAALARALRLVLQAALLDDRGALRVEAEVLCEGTAVVLSGPRVDPAVVAAADRQLAPAGGRAWMERDARARTSQDTRVCLVPVSDAATSPPPA